MRHSVKLPIGIEDFKEIRTEGFYYVDKTEFIAALLNNWGKVNLFTRLRRFGKSLNMDMLRCFFSYGCDPAIFHGLAISRETGLCEKYMGNFPVIAITLKGIEAHSYEEALAMLRSMIGNTALEFSFLSESPCLSPGEKLQYAQLTHMDGDRLQGFTMPEYALKESLRTLSRLLHRHYGQKAVLL